MCRHIYDWNIVGSDFEQPIHLASLLMYKYHDLTIVEKLVKDNYM